MTGSRKKGIATLLFSLTGNSLLAFLFGCIFVTSWLTSAVTSAVMIAELMIVILCIRVFLLRGSAKQFLNYLKQDIPNNSRFCSKKRLNLSQAS